MRNLGKSVVDHVGATRLQHMVRAQIDANPGPLTALRRIAALALIVGGGIALASWFLKPALALAAALPSDATGAHAWIVDGGGEVAPNPGLRIEIMLEYLVLGVAAIVLALRFGKGVIARMQDWYEGEPLMPTRPVAQPVPAVAMPRPGERAKRAAQTDRNELHTA